MVGGGGVLDSKASATRWAESIPSGPVRHRKPDAGDHRTLSGDDSHFEDRHEPEHRAPALREPVIFNTPNWAPPLTAQTVVRADYASTAGLVAFGHFHGGNSKSVAL